MSEEIKADHFKTMEDLLKHLKMWEEDDDYDAYYRFFCPRCAYEMAHKIEKQNELLSKKDKVIDLMALHIASSAIVDDMVCMYKDCENENCTADMSIQCTKEYFCKKAEEEK